MTTKKEDLIRALVTQAGIRKGSAQKCVEIILTTIGQSLRAKTPVILQGIGKFDIVEHKAKRTYDFINHESVIASPRTVIKFKPCHHMKTL